MSIRYIYIYIDSEKGRGNLSAMLQESVFANAVDQSLMSLMSP